MDPVAETILYILGGILGGGGATYGVQRLRNGYAPAPAEVAPADCTEKHDVIRGEFREAHASLCHELRDTKEEIKESIHELTTEVRVGFRDVYSDAKDAARAELKAHEQGPYHGSSDR